MPGAAALSSGGRSAAASRRESVVRKPAMAGPKPTQAMSTAIVWRSGSSRGPRGSKRRLLCALARCAALLRVVERLGDHHLRERLGGAILREHRAGEAAVDLHAQASGSRVMPWHDAQGPSLSGWLPSARTSIEQPARPGMIPSSASASFADQQASRPSRVPRRVAVVAVDELGADAADLARGARRLDVAEVGEEAGRAGARRRRAPAPPSSASATASRICARAAMSQASASASLKVTPWRGDVTSFAPSASVAPSRWR